MKKYLHLLIYTLLGGFILLSSSARADHLMGSDITWKCLGTDTYVVTVTVYRDCNGISMPGQDFTMSCVGKSSTSTDVSTTQSKGVDITPVCGKSCDRCGKVVNTAYGDQKCKFPYGVEMYTFTAKVIFSKLASFKGKKGCCGVNVSWDQCCRSGTLTDGGNWQGFHVEATLNRCLKPCDNSPIFSNAPVVMICAGQCFSYNPGMTDVDVDANGAPDSLVYSLVKPLSAVGTAVTYTGKFAYNKPLTFDSFPNTKALWNPPSCAGFHLDSFTGDLQFEPMKVEQTVMAIQVQEYTKDTAGKPVLKGTTRRDFQIIVMKCPNNHPPTLTGIDGTNSSDADFCVNQYNCFTINSNDVDVNDTVSVNWNKALASLGATFVTEKKKQHPRSTFCWKPGPAQAGHTYQFVVSAHDDACPLPGRTQRSFRIHVHPSPTGKVTVTDNGCGNFTLKLKLDTLNSITGLPIWTGDQGLNGKGYTINYHYRTSGTVAHYTVTYGKQFVSAAGIQICNTVDSGSFNIPSYVYVAIPHDTLFCKTVSTSFVIPSSVSGGTRPYKYLWSTGDTTGTIGVKVTHDSVFYLTITDNNGKGCVNADTMHIRTLVPPAPGLGPDQRLCNGETTIVKDNSTHDSTGYHWFNLATPGFLLSDSSSAIIKDSGTYIARTNDAKLKTCYNYDTINVYVNQPVRVYPQTINACANTPLTLDAGKGSGDTNAVWQWRDLYNPSIIYHNGRTWKGFSAKKDVHFLVSAKQIYKGVTCGDTDTINVLLYPLPANVTANIPNQCYNNPPVDLSVYTSSPGGVWVPDTVMNTFSNSVNKAHFYPDSAGVGAHGVFYITVDPKSGCKNIQQRPIRVDTLPIVTVTPKAYQCIDNPSPFDLNTLSPAPSGGTWSGPAVTNNRYFNQNDPNAGGAGVKHFTYSYQNKFSTSHCTGKASADITVYPVIHPNGGADQSSCRLNSVPILLNGNLDSSFSPGWYIDSSLGSPYTPANALQTSGGQYIFRPDLADTGVHILVYQGSFNGRCPKNDTVIIHVYPNPVVQLTGPTAVCLTGGPVKLVGTPKGNGTYWMQNNNNGALNGQWFYPEKAGPGPHKFAYFYQDGATSCWGSDSLTIVVSDTPFVHITRRNLDTCMGSQISINAKFGNGVTGLNWDTTGTGGNYLSSISQTNRIFVPGNHSSFWIKITGTGNSSACPAPSDSILVNMDPYPVAAFNITNGSGCTPLNVLFNDLSSVSSGQIAARDWNFGDNTGDVFDSQTVHHRYAKDTTAAYTVTLRVTTKRGCSAFSRPQSVQVFATPRPWFDAVPFYTTIIMPDITFNDSTTINDPKVSRGDLVHKWSFGDGTTSDTRAGTFVHTYSDTGIYTVKLFVRNPEYNCAAETTRVDYIIIKPELLVFIPNAFTPNHLYNEKTIVNEKFTPVISNYSSFHMDIFSRWGELLYQTSDLTKGWDGTFMGKSCEEGVYIYKVDATSLEGKRYKYSGSITLLK